MTDEVNRLAGRTLRGAELRENRRPVWEWLQAHDPDMAEGIAVLHREFDAEMTEITFNIDAAPSNEED